MGTMKLLVAFAVAEVLAAGTRAAPDLPLPGLSDKEIKAFLQASDRASAAVEKKDRAGALRAYDRALAIHRGNDGHWYNRACLDALEGRAEAALSDLEEALAAGWADAQWPKEDGDLASLRDRPPFEDWLARVAGRAPVSPAWDVAVAALPPTAEALGADADAAVAALRRLRGVIGNAERERAEATLLAWRAASWAHLASLAPDAAAREGARMEELKVLAGRDATRLPPAVARRLEERAAAFVGDEPASDEAPDARLLIIEARHALVPHEVKPEQTDRLEAAGQRFERDLLAFVVTHETGEAAQRALVRLIALRAEADRDLALALLARLRRELAGDEARVRTLVTNASRGAYYELAGLPPFSATTLDGRAVSPETLRGRVTLIDFWATWCGPCREELPNIKDAHATFHARGFDVLGISLDDAKRMDARAFEAWCAANGVVWSQVYDGKYWEADLAKLFNVQGIPFPLLLDREGRVVATDGEARGPELGKRVAALLGDGGEAVPVVGQ